MTVSFDSIEIASSHRVDRSLLNVAPSPLAATARRTSGEIAIPNSLGIRVHGPCQDAGDSFGFQEELWSTEDGPRFTCRMMFLEYGHCSVSLV